jgi:hypothetical protein
MMVVLLAALGPALMALATIRWVLPMVRRRRLARELRSDWWSGFERDFRAYVRSSRRDTRGRARPGH